MTTVHYRIGSNYLGGFGDGAEPTDSDAVVCPPPSSSTDVWSGNAWVAPAPTGDDVNNERDRRVTAGSTFTVTGYGDIPVAGDETTARNLQGLAFAAQMRVAQGDVTTLTPYRDEANAIHQLTPPQMIELWSLGASFISAVYQASWVLKDGASIPVDFTSDGYWP